MKLMWQNWCYSFRVSPNAGYVGARLPPLTPWIFFNSPITTGAPPHPPLWCSPPKIKAQPPHLTHLPLENEPLPIHWKMKPLPRYDSQLFRVFLLLALNKQMLVELFNLYWFLSSGNIGPKFWLQTCYEGLFGMVFKLRQ